MLAHPPRGRPAALPFLVALLLCGCNLTVGRGPVSDFFLKDYDLPPYQVDEAHFQRRRRVLEAEELEAAAGGMGGFVGAMAGGRLKSWDAAASGALGGVVGAAAGRTFSRAERADPLPDEYPILSLALPIIATDPNKGPTLGLLPVVVMREGRRITDIFAPDVTWNEIDGLAGTFRMRRFFSRDATLMLDVGVSQEGAHDHDLVFAQRRVGPGDNLYFRARGWYSVSLANRFYGLGNESDQDDESSYVFRHTEAVATLGIELPLHFSLEAQERLVSNKVGPGRLDDVPSTRAAFPDVRGVNDDRLTILSHRVRLVFDSRDSRGAPTEGVYGEFSYEAGDATTGGDVDFDRFAFAFTILLPKFDRRFITVVHAAGWLVLGKDLPFYEMTRIGGKNTHRGYGEGRFVDQNGFVASVEERWNLFEYELMDVRQILQLAGFVDIGRVYGREEAITLEDLKVAGGAAIRLIVPDSELVASIDLGISDEGPAVFVGLNYPY